MKNLSNLIKLNKGGQGGGKGGGTDAGTIIISVAKIIKAIIKNEDIEEELRKMEPVIKDHPVAIIEAKASMAATTSCPQYLEFIENKGTFSATRRLAVFGKFGSLNNRAFYQVNGSTVEECKKYVELLSQQQATNLEVGATPIYMRVSDWLELQLLYPVIDYLVANYSMTRQAAELLAYQLVEQGIVFGVNDTRKLDLNTILISVGKENLPYDSFRGSFDTKVKDAVDKLLQDSYAEFGDLITIKQYGNGYHYDTFQFVNGAKQINANTFGGDYSDYQAYLQKIENAGIKHAGTITYATQSKLNGKPHAHHIVMKKHPSESARKSRELLVTYGINPYYSPANLCLAPNNGNLKDTEYADQVYARIKTKTSKADIIEELDKIAIEIQNRAFPKPADGGTKKTTNSNTKTIPTGKDPLKDH